MCKTTINTGLQREGENGMRGCFLLWRLPILVKLSIHFSDS